MRIGGIQQRLVQVSQTQQLPPGLPVGPRMGLPAPPPPPPPYPGPPPPYPGSKTSPQQPTHQHSQQVKFNNIFSWHVEVIILSMFLMFWYNGSLIKDIFR